MVMTTGGARREGGVAARAGAPSPRALDEPAAPRRAPRRARRPPAGRAFSNARGGAAMARIGHAHGRPPSAARRAALHLWSRPTQTPARGSRWWPNHRRAGNGDAPAGWPPWRLAGRAVCAERCGTNHSSPRNHGVLCRGPRRRCVGVVMVGRVRQPAAARARRGRRAAAAPAAAPAAAARAATRTPHDRQSAPEAAAPRPPPAPPSPRPFARPFPSRPSDLARGEKIFKTKCAQCHVAEKGGGHKQVREGRGDAPWRAAAAARGAGGWPAGGPDRARAWP